MKKIYYRHKLSEEIIALKKEGKKIGFVPTMGALHKGHISLISNCTKYCDISICSIFVNSLQFNNQEDLKKYPRTIENDCKLLEEVGCNIVFMPESEEVYPKGFEKVQVNVDKLNSVFEGFYRPNHFDGVIQVLHQFFLIIKPDFVFLGEKDIQQCYVVKELINQLHPNINIVICPTLRENNGLAMSSRNSRLSPQEFEKASVIYKSFLYLENLLSSHSIEVSISKTIELINKSNIKVEYLSIINDNFEIVKKVEKRKSYRAIFAGYMGAVRLIDNTKITVI